MYDRTLFLSLAKVYQGGRITYIESTYHYFIWQTLSTLYAQIWIFESTAEKVYTILDLNFQNEARIFENLLLLKSKVNTGKNSQNQRFPNSGIVGSGGNVEWVWSSPKPNPQGTVTIWPVWQLAKEFQSQDLSLFDLTQSSLSMNIPTHRAFIGNNQWQLLNITTVWGSITSWG